MAQPAPTAASVPLATEERVAVRVWDLPVRLVHWAFFGLLAFQLVTGYVGGEAMEWHAYSGYCLLALVIFRVLWGFAGSTHARFASFVAGPGAAWRFARRLFSREAVPQVGHNPLGGWMVIALLADLALQAATGLFANDGVATQGPLAPLVATDLSLRLSQLHRWNVNVLVALSALHVAAALFHWLAKGEDLIAAMFTGVKRVPPSILRERRTGPRTTPPRRVASRENPGEATFPGGWRAAALLALSAAIVIVIVRAASWAGYQ